MKVQQGEGRPEARAERVDQQHGKERARAAHAWQPEPIYFHSGAPQCDIQDVTHLDDAYRQDFIAAADVLFLSAANYADPEPLITELLQRKARQIVVVGMGARGCAIGTHDGIRRFPPVAIDLPVINTNGAGDGLAAGFLSSYVPEGYAIDELIHRGQIVARYTCAQRAAKVRLITTGELNRYARAATPILG